MGIDGSEIKKRNAAKKESIKTDLGAPQEDQLKPIEKPKSTIDKLRPFMLFIIVPILLGVILIRYSEDYKNTPKSYQPKATTSLTTSTPTGYAEAASTIINIQFGKVCTAEITGFFSKTLKIDWTNNTTKLNAVIILGEIGKIKEDLYSDGVRYLQFPNDSGTYNVIDWKTGNKNSISDRAKYSF